MYTFHFLHPSGGPLRAENNSGYPKFVELSGRFLPDRLKYNLLNSIRATYSSILRTAFPIFLALLIPQVSYVANSIFLGSYGELELRVIGVAGVFYLILSMTGQGFSNGLQIMMSRRMGEGKKEELATTLANGLLLSLVFSIVIAIITYFLSPLFFQKTLKDPENIAASVRFLHVRIWGLPFLMLSQLANAFFIATQRPGYLIYASLSGTFVNILLDYLLIFGHFGFPAMGLAGAAYASIAGEVTAFLISLLVYFGTTHHRLFPIKKRQLRINYALSRNTLIIASPLIVQFLFSIGGWQIFFIYVEHLGNRELAASQAIRSLYGFTWVGIWAFAATANTMVSNIIGQGKQSRVVYLTFKIAAACFCYAVIVAGLVWIFAVPLISVFRADSELIQLALPVVRLVAISTLIMSVSTVLFNSVVGTGNTLMNMAMEIICVLSYVIYCSVFIEKLKWPLIWAWGSEFAYWGTLLILAFAYLKSGKWKNKAI